MLLRTLPILALTLVVASLAVAADAGSDGVVNINTASQDQLELLPRVGPKVAERIVAFRDANGGFESVEELTAVKGIGDATLERLRPFVTTQGETTLTDKVRSSRAANSRSS